MSPERFWELVETLDGVADDTTTPALDRMLRDHGEGENFLDLVEEHVERILERCEVPASHQGDTAEWIAAAVIAAGRAEHDRVLLSGAALVPDDWAWAEAENLLVAGAAHDQDTPLPGSLLGLTLEWKTTDLPADMESTFDPRLDRAGDDPRHGRTITHDPAWAEAVLRLDADPEFHRRRASIGDVGLHLKVREAEEMELTPWPSEDQVDDVVLSVPVAAFTAKDRVDVYVRAVAELVLTVQETLGRD
ncbi:hypothetical protein NPS01_15720 [Nocardioides psychrotolerans]|uniref:DUF4240 domain-containing protein n=1 Tax=Nocardioides psychrotolerans TaxID=1005945 RepID=A0A1I3F0Z4_9ACTN|nr:hypothetical protein [Nocardioides psychrotolerans]GEP37909.1 hypothetical protein NPS01_15720 [Nocardioides psychrotolerans]SFI04830.1 hypothetical protein SAMN05216561_104170 [Nocardioides psychrotolerans]